MRYAKFQRTYMENVFQWCYALLPTVVNVWLPWVDDVVTDKDERTSKITLKYSGYQIFSAFT
jgi:hypothetical protein